jgi:hypothetical protein
MEEKSARWGRRLEALLDERRAREGPAVHTPAAGVHLHRTRSDYTSPVLWDQALYEGLMEGLGYSKNRAAFRTLARSVPLASLRRIGLGNTGDILAILFGASHLLPDAGTIEEPLARRYAAGLAGRWGELSHAFHPVPLRRSDWLFFRLRPPNFPTARLAAFAHAIPIVFGPGFRGCIDVLRAGTPPARTLRRLTSLLSVRAAGFWRYRTHFDAPAADRGSAIGRTRATELVINTVLPLSLRCANMFGDSVLRDGVGSLMTEPFACPAPRLMARLREDLLRGRVAVETPLLYQGAVGLFADHCTRLRCRACAVGEACGFVRSSAASSSPQGRECC